MAQRSLPHSLDAEMSVLAASMELLSAARQASMLLESKHFYKPSHQLIFEGITTLLEEGQIISPVSIQEWILENDAMAPEKLVHEFCESAYDPDLTKRIGWSDVASLCQTILKHHGRRKLILDAQNLIDKMMGHGDPEEEAAGFAEALNHSILAESSTWIPQPTQSTPLQEIDLSKCHGSRTDGAKLFYPGKISTLVARPGSGKSMLALATCLEANKAVYVDYETTEGPWRERALEWYQSDEEALNKVHYLSPTEPITAKGIRQVREYAKAVQPDFIVIDGFNKLLGLHELDGKSNPSDIGKAFAQLISPWQWGGAALCIIDHVKKDEYDTKGATTAAGSGSREAITDIMITLTPNKGNRIARGGLGSAVISIGKDRYGRVIQDCDADQETWGSLVVKSNKQGIWQHALIPSHGAAVKWSV
jgi:hypothetical protein